MNITIKNMKKRLIAKRKKYLFKVKLTIETSSVFTSIKKHFKNIKFALQNPKLFIFYIIGIYIAKKQIHY